MFLHYGTALTTYFSMLVENDFPYGNLGGMDDDYTNSGTFSITWTV
jgi:hypothetical protein